MGSHYATGDLVVISLPGVQRFIGAAQSTGDLRAASQMIAELARVAARSCDRDHGRLIFPTVVGDRDGMPNRVVALTTEASCAGEVMAKRAADAVREEWRRWVRRVFQLAEDDPGVPETPGMPLVRWVCVQAGEHGYPGQWERARHLLAARRIVRDFEQVGWFGRELCVLSPQQTGETKIKGLPDGRSPVERWFAWSGGPWVGGPLGV